MEIKKAISQEDMRKQDMSQGRPSYPPRDPYGGRDPYAGYPRGGGMPGYGDYRAMSGRDE